MNCLQIIIKKDNYKESQIIAIGKHRNNRLLLPQIICPKNFDEEYYKIWENIITIISNIDPNGWQAIQVLATKEEKIEKLSNEEGDYEIIPYISLMILRIWDDGTSDEQLILNFEDKNILNLWNYIEKI